jgi:hypothetical protein
MMSPRRKGCVVSLTDVRLGISMTATIAVVLTGGEMS